MPINHVPLKYTLPDEDLRRILADYINQKEGHFFTVAAENIKLITYDTHGWEVLMYRQGWIDE